MAALSDKLKALGVTVGTRDLPPPAKRLSRAYPIEQVISGYFQSTRHGNVFVKETNYDPAYRHGRVGLRTEASLEIIASWAQERQLVEDRLDQFAFLDTETSGLAGGTGTYTFLVGAGRFEGSDFRLAQFFMRDPDEEPAQLAALADFLHPCKVLVTFNGKSFDAPLLNTRYTLNDLQSPLPTLAHLDLLPLARRLWRDRLPSRRLGELEFHAQSIEGHRWQSCHVAGKVEVVQVHRKQCGLAHGHSRGGNGRAERTRTDNVGKVRRSARFREVPHRDFGNAGGQVDLFEGLTFAGRFEEVVVEVTR